MSQGRQRNAFTLIEVLIVVIIMAVLAATIIPQFSSSTKDAKESSLNFNAHTMQSQVEVYKMHHVGKLPGGTSGDFSDQMTKATNIGGTVNPGAADPVAYPYGPYMQEIPANPYNNLKTVVEQATADGDDSTGWQFDTTTGRISPNNADWTAP